MSTLLAVDSGLRVTSFVVILGIVQLLIALSSFFGGRRNDVDELTSMEAEMPSVTLFVPCCGVEEGLAANLKALAQQDYPNLQLVFVVERADDAAIPFIKRFPVGELVIAGAAEGRGQKVHNLLAAIDGASPSDVLAFADSDGRPDPGWLRRLVRKLDRPGVGVASTYRFYVPEPLSFSTLLRSVWNASVLALLGNHDRNFAWGGGMAIRRDVFERIGVVEAWQRALSDDYALTHAVRRAGLKVSFVPDCLVPSYGRVGLLELGSWVTRQTAITRVYWPALFRVAVLHHGLYSAFLLLGPWAGGKAGLILWLLVLALGAYSGGSRAIASPWGRRYWWAYATLFPLSSFLTIQAAVRALASRCITWRGRVYEMRSPTETVIH